MYQKTDSETKEMLAAVGIVGSKPVTGVFTIHELEHIGEDIDYRSVNVTFEEHCRHECPEDSDDCDCHYEDMGADTHLIGFVYNEKTGQYDIDQPRSIPLS